MRCELRTTCNRDCPDSCGIVATVEDGRIIDHRGDPEHGVTRGLLCARGNEYLERFYHRDRLLQPLRRNDRGGFEPIAWSAALELIAGKLSAIRDGAGPEAVLHVEYSGIHHWVGRVLSRLFWAHFGGPTDVRGGLSVEALHAAQQLDFGGDCTHDPEDLPNARAFVVWGKNLAVTRLHWMPFVKQARRAGAPLWVIDPLPSITARRADRFLQVRPGADGALAQALIHRLLEWGAVDRGFIEQHTQGFEELRREIQQRSLAALVEATGLGAEVVDELARLYAEVKPLATMVGLGAGYWEHGGAAVRLIDALAAITGNVGVAGGGVSTDLMRPSGLDLSMLKTAPRHRRRTLLLPRLAQEIREASPPLQMAWVAGANPCATAPESAAIQRELRALPFVVVVDQFLTATAEAADVVLPCTTYLEMDDLVTAYGHQWLGLTRRVVPPLGECKTDGEIYQLLAERLGFGAALAGSAEDWLRRLLAPLEPHGITLEALRERPRRHPLALAVPFADRRFRTPSTKVELLSELPPLPRPLEANELHLLATKTLHMVNAQALPARLPEQPEARLHPDRLRREGLVDGDRAWVVSAAGRVLVRLRGDAGLRGDSLLMNPALWREDARGVNQLREARLTDLGDGAALHETRVRLEPAS